MKLKKHELGKQLRKTNPPHFRKAPDLLYEIGKDKNNLEDFTDDDMLDILERTLERLTPVFLETDPVKKMYYVDIITESLKKNFVIDNIPPIERTIKGILANDYNNSNKNLPPIDPEQIDPIDYKERFDAIHKDQINCLREWVYVLCSDITKLENGDIKKSITCYETITSGTSNNTENLRQEMIQTDPESMKRDLDDYTPMMRFLMLLSVKNLKEDMLSKEIRYNDYRLSLAMPPEVSEIAIKNTFSKIFKEFEKHHNTPTLDNAKIEIKDFLNDSLDAVYAEAFEHIDKSIEGSWKAYTAKKNSIFELTEDLRGFHAKWCVKTPSVAEMHISSHKEFRVYYTKDDKGNDTMPRLAIMVESDTTESGKELISGITGISYRQNIDGYIYPIIEKDILPYYEVTDVLAYKLEKTKEFEELYKKYKSDEEFTDEDYQSISTFGKDDFLGDGIDQRKFGMLNAKTNFDKEISNVKRDKQKLKSGEMAINESMARDFTNKYKKYFSKPGEGHYCLRKNQLELLEELKSIPQLYRPELFGN